MLERVVTRIAALTWKHPKKGLAAVGIFTILAFAFSSDVEQHLKAAGFSDPDTQSQQQQNLLIEKTGSESIPAIVVRIPPPAGQKRLALHAPTLQREARRVARTLHSLDDASSVENPLAGGPPQLIAPNRSSLLI